MPAHTVEKLYSKSFGDLMCLRNPLILLTSPYLAWTLLYPIVRFPLTMTTKESS